MCGVISYEHIGSMYDARYSYKSSREELSDFSAEWNSSMSDLPKIRTSEGDIINRAEMRGVQDDLIRGEKYQAAAVLDDILDADRGTDLLGSLIEKYSRGHDISNLNYTRVNDIANQIHADLMGVQGYDSYLPNMEGDTGGIDRRDLLFNEFQGRNADKFNTSIHNLRK